MPRSCLRLAACSHLFAISVLFAGFVMAAEPTATSIDDLVKEIENLSVKSPTSPAARAAWEKLAAGGPAELSRLLEAMDTSDTVAANWFRTAFDRIVAREMKRDGGKKIDVMQLLAFVKDAKHQGRTRRMVLELVERLRPGTTKRLIPGWLHDPEFRYEAIEHLLQEGDALLKAGKKAKAVALFQTAFDACREVKQAQQLASRLKDAGVAVSLADHFGFLTDWYVIGPFDGMNQKGFHLAYPPEEKVDLKAALPGKMGMVKWKRYRAKEALSGSPQRAVLVNLLDPLGQTDDAVAYAFTKIRVDKPLEVELRGAADDNFTVWVNGQRKFGFEEYYNGVRLDRHRFRAKLKAGVNSVLVKICQMKNGDPPPEPNWEFLLRIVDTKGEAVKFSDALGKE